MILNPLIYLNMKNIHNMDIVRFADSVNNHISGPSVANYDLLMTLSKMEMPKTYMVTYKEKSKKIKYPDKVKLIEVNFEQSKDVSARMPFQPHFNTVNRALDIAEFLEKDVASIAVSGKYSPQAEQFSCLLKNYKKNCKLVVEGHGSEVCGYQLIEFENLYKNIYRKADLVVLMETPFAKYMFERDGFPIDNMAVCPTVVRWEDEIKKLQKNPEKLEEIRNKYFKKFKIPENASFILTIGRFQKEKGHKYLIKAVKNLLREHKNLYLLLGGSEKGVIEEISMLIKDEGKIKLIGKVPFSDFYALIANSMAFIIPSIEIWRKNRLYFAETGPRTVVEAMAAGIVGKNVVIASNSGGTPWKFNMEKWFMEQIKIGNESPEIPVYDEIDDKVYNAKDRALLVEQKDIKAIEKAVRVVIEDEKFAERMNREASKYVRRYYNSMRIASIYNDLIGNIFVE